MRLEIKFKPEAADLSRVSEGSFVIDLDKLPDAEMPQQFAASFSLSGLPAPLKSPAGKTLIVGAHGGLVLGG